MLRGVPPDKLKEAKRLSRVRAIVCCLGVGKLMISGADVARKLQLSPSAVSKLAARGRVDSVMTPTANNLFDCK